MSALALQRADAAALQRDIEKIQADGRKLMKREDSQPGDES